jgi:bifunctional UDP-N-acetylglucosamine pyrophosphorylase/glucosamine-1-phosphate N-acetyltransferase
VNPPSPTSPTGTVAVVLAAGLGTRMRSSTPKVLHELCGRPMLAYVLDAWASTADAATVGRPVVVYSPSVEAILAAVGDRATFALQESPRGTGDAVRAALTAVPADATEILVLSGDVPLVTGADLEAVLEARRQDDAALALASVFAAEPARLGRIVRSEFGTVERIVEANDATPDELDGNEVNAGIYAFDAEWLGRRIAALEPSAVTGELYLTDLVALAREDGRIVSAVAFEDDGRFEASTTALSLRPPSGAFASVSTKRTCAMASRCGTHRRSISTGPWTSAPT